MSKAKEKIVLVLGSFHTSDCWKLLIPELQEIGIQPYAVTLVGHENDKESAFSIRLQSYVNQVILPFI